MFLSFVRPERISSPITRRPAVTISGSIPALTPYKNGWRSRLIARRRKTQDFILAVRHQRRRSSSPRAFALALEDVVHMGAQELSVAARLEEGLHIGVPASNAVLHDDERGPKRLGRIMEKRLENEVLGAFHIELDHIDALEFLFGHELHQGRGRHLHGKPV